MAPPTGPDKLARLQARAMPEPTPVPRATDGVGNTRKRGLDGLEKIRALAQS